MAGLLAYWIHDGGPERDESFNKIRYYLYGVAAGIALSIAAYIYFKLNREEKSLLNIDAYVSSAEFKALSIDKDAFINEFNNIKKNIASSWT